MQAEFPEKDPASGGRDDQENMQRWYWTSGDERTILLKISCHRQPDYAYMDSNRILIFDGQQVLRINSVGFRHLQPDWCTPKRTISDYEILLVSRGEVTFTIGDETVFIREGEARLIFPHEVHYAPAGQDADLFWFHFSAPIMPGPMTTGAAREHLAKAREISPTNASISFLLDMQLHEIVLAEHLHIGRWRNEVLAELRTAIHELDHPYPNSYGRLRSCLTSVLLLLTRRTIEHLQSGEKGGRAANWPMVQRALFRISEAAARPLTVEALAREQNTSPQNLIRQFRACLGIRPGQVIEETRRQRAAELLRDPALSIKEVAHATGARSASEFSRWFKRGHGCSPREFRWGTSPAP